MHKDDLKDLVVSLYSEFGTAIYVGIPLSSLMRHDRCRSAEVACRLCEDLEKDGLLRFLSDGQIAFVGGAHAKYGVGPPPPEYTWQFDEQWARFLVSFPHFNKWERVLKLYLLTKGKPFRSLDIQPPLRDLFEFKLVPQFLNGLSHSQKINYLLSQNLGRSNGGIGYSWILVPSDGQNLLKILEAEHGSSQTITGPETHVSPEFSIRDRQRDREKALSVQVAAAIARAHHQEQEVAKLKAVVAGLRAELIKAQAKHLADDRELAKLRGKLKTIALTAREALNQG